MTSLDPSSTSSIISTHINGAIIGSLGGLVARLAPELLKSIQHASERRHEYKMRKLELDGQGKEEVDKLQVKLGNLMTAGSVSTVPDLDSHISAVMDKSIESRRSLIRDQRTSSPLARLISDLVRPTVTFWWMALFTLVKMIQIYLVINYTHSITNIADILELWTPDEVLILSGIINFWYLDRVINKNKGIA